MREARKSPIIINAWEGEMKKIFLAAVIVCLAFSVPVSGGGGKIAVSPEVMKLHKDAIVADLHADTQFLVTYEGYDMSKRHRTVDWGYAGVIPLFSDIDIPRLREGGVDLFAMAICPAPKDNRRPGAESFTKRSLAAIEKTIVKNPRDLAIARSPGEAREIIASGKIAVLVALEGGQGINNNLDNLREYYQRGVRYMTLTHSNNLDWATSAGKESKANFKGLTEFGKQVVREMVKMGMMIDLSHASPDTFWATLETTHCPVIVTHAAARGMGDHHRNLSDAQIKAIASRGGVVGVIYFCKYLDPTRQKPCTVGLVADHIDYIKKLAGVDVIALGSDWDGNVTVPKDLSDASKLPNLTAELVRRGYSDQEIKNILGENFLRAWASIQACR